MKAIVTASVLSAALLGGVGARALLHADDRPAPVTKESSAAFRSVVKAVLPAVVSIKTEMKSAGEGRGRKPGQKFRSQLPEDLPDDVRERMEEMFGNLKEMPRPRVQGFGSGVIISADGVVLTNNHVVDGASSVEVTLQNGQRYTSTDIKRDPKTDLAIVKLDAKGKSLPYAKLGDNRNLEIGDWVLAMGAPFELAGSVTSGIISAKGREIAQRLNDRQLMYQDFLQTDAAINPGNSGGPLVDLDGNVVGINTAIESRTGTFAGVGFAIPASLAHKVVDDLVKFGKVKRSYLGVQMQNIEAAVAQRLGVENGVVISNVYDDSPAKKAGLAETDVVLSANGKPITDTRTLQSIVTETSPGKSIDLQVVSGGKNRRTVSVKLEEQPDEFGVERRSPARAREPKAPPPEGVALGDVGIQVEAKDNGLVVTEVEDGSLAQLGNIPVGSRILSVEGKEVKSTVELKAALKQVDVAKKGLMLTIRTPDGSTRMTVLQGDVKR